MNWWNEIFGGGILLKSGIIKHARFILYLVLLIILYITLSNSVDAHLRREKGNNDKLRELKSEYISKSARLQYESKKGEVEKRLIEMGSTLEVPKEPPGRVILE